MLKTVFAFALLATSGAALANQEQTAPTEEIAEAVAPAGEADAAEQPSEGSASEGDEAAAAGSGAGADDAAEEDYRAAVRAFRKCRQTAQAEGGVAAARSCNSKRKDMMDAKELLREAK